MSASVSSPSLHQLRARHPLLVVALAAVAWWLVYRQLEPLSFAIVGRLPLAPESHLAGALQFFLYDAPKVLLLLTGVVFLMGVVHTFVSPEKTRSLLAGRRVGVGNAMAALLGVVTPFCSCSAVPLFIGFLQAGVPLGVTFSFLIAAPMVNEVALGLLFSLFGWRIALLYLAMGLLVALVAGVVIGALGLEGWLEGWVRELQAAPVVAGHAVGQAWTWSERVDSGVAHVRDIVGRVWPWIVGGVAVGAGIHGFVPQDFLAAFMGRDAWWAVPAAVLVGVPLYTNAAGVIPIVQALLAKGAALGTVLAFMMSVIALSAPELIILRKVLQPRLIAVFVGVVTTGILLVGFAFNHLL
ncbi:permease [Myxococcota bacterium]|nr:permease [Myxococcota bacterium]